ncbi:MAG: hypothetical protein DI527_00475 [Chelatococcus sp.]|nr:MAG: hypothetical protein DI527_00475 [Chelatococcus sp.]
MAKPILSRDEWTILRRIEADPVGFGVRIEISLARSRLKRLGYIESRPSNAGRSRQIAGKAHVWRFTAEGRARFEAGE